MRWFRVHFDVGWSSVIVRAESREEAVKEIWKALEVWSRGAAEGLRFGRYTVAEEPPLNLQDTDQEGVRLLALVSAPESQRDRRGQAAHSHSPPP